MKGVNYVTDSNNKMTAVVIGLKTLTKYDKQLEDLLNVIVVESRRHKDGIPWEKAKKLLKQKGMM